MFFRFVPRGDPAEARTQDPQIKSLLLYPSDARLSLVFDLFCKIRDKIEITC